LDIGALYQKSRPSSNLGVIAPGGAHPRPRKCRVQRRRWEISAGYQVIYLFIYVSLELPYIVAQFATVNGKVNIASRRDTSKSPGV